MNVYSMGCEASRGLAISMGDPRSYEQFTFLDPDPDLYEVNQAARTRAAAQWKGLTIHASQSEGVRSRAYFQDAAGSGFYLPGCVNCVSDHARSMLEAALGDQAAFLPIDIVGSPMRYWVLYATRYYDKIDLGRSRTKTPADYIADRRLELREPYFLDSAELDNLYIFRVAGSMTYTPFALGDYVTQRFVDLVFKHKLGGFSFARVRPYGEKPPPDEPPLLISRGPKYKPLWQIQ